MNKTASLSPWYWIAFMLLIVSLPGCGGCDGTSQADMMRAAMRNSGNEDADEEETSNTGGASNATSATPTSGNATAALASVSNDEAIEETPSTTNDNQTNSNRFTQQSRSDNDAVSKSDEEEPVEQVTQSRATNNWQPVTSLQARRAKSIENMQRIAQAFEKTMDETKAVPLNAIYDAKGQPLLSWRVAILPQIGYGWLYEQFHLDEPWNSPHNRNLLDLIPECYRDPQSNDHLTVYQVPVGTFTAFPPIQKSILKQRVEDGLGNTVLLMEVDRDVAVPWTEPRDLRIDSNMPANHLGGLYEDGFFVAWGDAEISCVRPETSGRDLYAMFSMDGGEPLTKSRICRAATPEVGGPSESQRVDIAEPSTTEIAEDPQNVSSESNSVGDREVNSSPLRSVGAAVNFNELAIESMRQGQMRQAFARKYASLLLEDPKRVVPQFGWSPALERPVLALRFGIGADITGPPARNRDFAPVESAPGEMTKLKGGYPGEQEVQKVAGELGLRLLALLRSRLDAGKFGTFTMQGDHEALQKEKRSSGDPNGPVLHYPGVQLIGSGSRRVLSHVAQRSECDVVVIFEIEIKITRSNQVHNTTVIKFFDAQSGRELTELPDLNNIKVEYDRADRLKDDPVVEWFQRLKDFVDEEIALQNLPQLRPEDARARLEIMGASPSENPLPLLAETQLYFGLGLISEFEYREACQAITGKQEAAVLVDGADLEKQRFLERWIPSEADEF